MSYLRNGERYGLGYCGSLIGSGIRPFRWNENHDLGWPSRCWHHLSCLCEWILLKHLYGWPHPSDSWASCSYVYSTELYSYLILQVHWKILTHFWCMTMVAASPFL